MGCPRVKCKGCGGWFKGCDLINGYCITCYNKMINKFKVFFKHFIYG